MIGIRLDETEQEVILDLEMALDAFGGLFENASADKAKKLLSILAKKIRKDALVFAKNKCEKEAKGFIKAFNTNLIGW